MVTELHLTRSQEVETVRARLDNFQKQRQTLNGVRNRAGNGLWGRLHATAHLSSIFNHLSVADDFHEVH